ncbi:unnamed protein product [Caenorhabditis angaria]|uniref:Uncharacterized protein n=1 Tax=Caenorhabditis angaria TaxID=860376 RepID=A0A9P1N9A0_9PELO|nr:unnamed protein product [Caenorhabditis angaria]
MPKKNSKKVALEESQFANLLASVLPAGMQLDASVMAALQQATNQELNQVLTQKAAEIAKTPTTSGQENSQQQQQ